METLILIKWLGRHAKEGVRPDELGQHGQGALLSDALAVLPKDNDVTSSASENVIDVDASIGLCTSLVEGTSDPANVNALT
jgi:hypothetical protein